MLCQEEVIATDPPAAAMALLMLTAHAVSSRLDTALGLLREDKPREAHALLVQVLAASPADARARELLTLAQRCVEEAAAAAPRPASRLSTRFSDMELAWFEARAEEDEALPRPRYRAPLVLASVAALLTIGSVAWMRGSPEAPSLAPAVTPPAKVSAISSVELAPLVRAAPAKQVPRSNTQRRAGSRPAPR
jgi:hypothetical protein